MSARKREACRCAIRACDAARENLLQKKALRRTMLRGAMSSRAQEALQRRDARRERRRVRKKDANDARSADPSMFFARQQARYAVLAAQRASTPSQFFRSQRCPYALRQDKAQVLGRQRKRSVASPPEPDPATMVSEARLRDAQAEARNSAARCFYRQRRRCDRGAVRPR